MNEEDTAAGPREEPDEFLAAFIDRAAVPGGDAGRISRSDSSLHGLGTPDLLRRARTLLWDFYGARMETWVRGWISPRADNDEDARRMVAAALRDLPARFAEYDPVESGLRIDQFAHWVASRAYVEHCFPQVGPRLKAWCKKRCDNAEDAAEVLSITLALIWRRARFLDPGGGSSFQSLVFLQAEFARREFYRRKGAERDHRHEIEREILASADIPSNPQLAPLQSETRKAILELLGLVCNIQHEPPRTLSFLVRRVFDWLPKKIVANLAKHRLLQILRLVKSEVAAECSGDEDFVAKEMQPLDRRMSEGADPWAARELVDCLPRPFETTSAAECISRWINTFARRLWTEVRRLERGALAEYVNRSPLPVEHSTKRDRSFDDDRRI